VSARSAIGAERASLGACAQCQRRSWLLAELSPMLDCLAGDRERLHGALALSDAELIDALGGRRRESLHARHAALDAGEVRRDADVETVCRHDPRYPSALHGPGSPRLLNVAGGAARLARLARAPVVALLGSTRASDYGREVARELARSLSASGVTIAGSLADGIAAAAHAGAQDGAGASIAMLGGGLRASCPAHLQALYGRLEHSGCAISELPCDCPGRRWGQPAAERTLLALAALVVVIEAREDPRELAAAHAARALGRPLAALPGRVTSPLSSGPHALLVEGASPIRGAEDVLELLYRDPSSHTGWLRTPGRERHVALEPRLRAVLDLVGAGADTPDRLAAAGAEPQELLLALTELELLGLLARGENGRYVPRCAGR
jgi:DNA processing protein